MLITDSKMWITDSKMWNLWNFHTFVIVACSYA